MRKDTAGGYLELVSEFELEPGAQIHPHRHHTLEFYYVLEGRGLMTVNNDTAAISPGDLVRIPPDSLHSLRAKDGGARLRCLAFSIGFHDTQQVDYETDAGS